MSPQLRIASLQPPHDFTMLLSLRPRRRRNIGVAEQHLFGDIVSFVSIPRFLKGREHLGILFIYKTLIGMLILGEKGCGRPRTQIEERSQISQAKRGAEEG